MNTNTHHTKMIIGLVLVAAVGALTALGDSGFGSQWIGPIITILVAFEHVANGNTPSNG